MGEKNEFSNFMARNEVARWKRNRVVERRGAYC